MFKIEVVDSIEDPTMRFLVKNALATVGMSGIIEKQLQWNLAQIAAGYNTEESAEDLAKKILLVRHIGGQLLELEDLCKKLSEEKERNNAS